MKGSQLIVSILVIAFFTVAGFLFGTGNLQITLFGWSFPSKPANPSLTLKIAPLSINENSGTATATVECKPVPSSNLTVTLSSSPLNEVTTPATVTIPTSGTATFAITGIDDASVEVNQTVTITAQAPGYSSGTETVTVLDDESAPSLALTFVSPAPTTINENGGTTNRGEDAEEKRRRPDSNRGWRICHQAA